MKFLDKENYFTDCIPHPQINTWLTTRHTDWDKLKQKLMGQGTKLVLMDQVHGQSVHEIGGERVDTNPLVVPETDAVFTKEKNVCLTVKTADCVPLLIYHPNPLIAAIHAGRKGLELGVVTETLRCMQEKVTDLEGLQIFVGPSICESCYEINRDTKTHYNLLEKVFFQVELLVKKPVYHFSNICTACQNQDYFSYRKGDQSDRLFSVIQLKEGR